MKPRPKGFTCYEGHHHATSLLARECDQRHWDKIERENPRLTVPLRTYPAPALLEQVEVFEGKK